MTVRKDRYAQNRVHPEPSPIMNVKDRVVEGDKCEDVEQDNATGANASSAPAEDLWSSEELLQAIQRTSVDGMVLIDRDCNVLWHNATVDKLKGNVVGQKCYEALENRDSRCPHCVHPEIFKDGIARDYETSINLPRGNTIDLWVMATPLCDEAGNITAILETSRDITERLRSEEDLRVSEEKFYKAFQSSPDFFAISDLETDAYVEVNQGFEKFTGYTKEEVIGRNSRDLNLWTDPVLRATVYEQLRKAESVANIEVKFRTKSGNYRFGVLSAEAIELNGRPHALVVVRDITVRVRAEEALRASEQKFFKAFESSPDAIAISDLDTGVYVDINKGYEEFTGYSRKEVIGRSSVELNLWWDNADRVAAYADLRRRGSARNVELRFRKKSGECRYAMISAEVIELDGRPHVLEVTRDITPRKQAEEEARLRQQQLVQADKMVSLGTLVAGVAHEINNPNTYIMSNALLFKNAWSDVEGILQAYYEENGDFLIGGIPYLKFSKEASALCSSIIDGSKRIKSIIKELRDYSRKPPSEMFEPLRINNVIQSAITLLSNMLKKSTDNFTIDLCERLPDVWGSPQRLEQVVINILQNACQALPDKSKGIFVSTEYEENAEQVFITVRDEGTGIPEEFVSRISDPFFSTKRESGGTGLGLAISSTIVKEHGGEIEVNSIRGEGTTVTVRLPAEKEGSRLPAAGSIE